MPIRQYKRIWCKTCNEFTLHHVHYLANVPLKCDVCDTDYTSVKLSEIPEDKLMAQRKRYKEQQSNSVWEVFGRIMNPSQGLFSEFPEVEILESDAGQKQLDDKIRAENAEKRAKWREQRDKDMAEIAKFKGIGRNDKCGCGSNLKFKKYCLNKIIELEIKYK